jgi:hypothetical protein
MSDHLTVTCDREFDVAIPGDTAAFSALLGAVPEACSASDQMVTRLQWWQPLTHWEDFRISRDDGRGARYVKVAPGMIVTIAPHAFRFTRLSSSIA